MDWSHWLSEVDSVVVNVDAHTTWQAVRHGDLSRSLVIRALLEVRGLPVRLGRLSISSRKKPHVHR